MAPTWLVVVDAQTAVLLGLHLLGLLLLAGAWSWRRARSQRRAVEAQLPSLLLAVDSAPVAML
ncbi:MAG TPA: hypothetical protein VF661_16690, partial [Actinomycetales bacterium]